LAIDHFFSIWRHRDNLDVKTWFGSSLDQGLMAALTTANDISVANFSSNKEAVQKYQR